MSAVDVFVMADTFQYSRQSFQNRTHIRTPQGRMWLSIPLEGGQHGRPIYQIQLDQKTEWASKHRRALRFNYSQTPYFSFYESELTFLNTPAETLAEITCASIEAIHRMYGLTCRLLRASELDGCPSSLEAILELLNPRSLVSSTHSFESDRGRYHTVDRFHFQEPEYRQHFDGFEYDITALDALSNYGPEAKRMTSVE